MPLEKWWSFKSGKRRMVFLIIQWQLQEIMRSVSSTDIPWWRARRSCGSWTLLGMSRTWRRTMRTTSSWRSTRRWRSTPSRPGSSGWALSGSEPRCPRRGPSSGGWPPRPLRTPRDWSPSYKWSTPGLSPTRLPLSLWASSKQEWSEASLMLDLPLQIWKWEHKSLLTN